MILKSLAFVIAWTISIVTTIGLCIFVVILSPILLCGWAMDKTFGPDGW